MAKKDPEDSRPCAAQFERKMAMTISQELIPGVNLITLRVNIWHNNSVAIT